LLADMSPEDLVRCIDFRYLADALTPDEAIDLLRRNVPTRADREAEMRRTGFPAYTTAVGWLGYSDEKVQQLCREAIAAGWTHFKAKVGVNVEDDVRRLRLLRDAVGPERTLMVDANQYWDVPTAKENMGHLAPNKPMRIEDPTSPDDILGHAAIARAVAPIGVATGDHCHYRVIF
jgi:L-fuconate dehydratase